MSELLDLLESTLGTSEQRSHGNYRFHCPLPGCSSIRKRLEIQVETNENGENPWHCWVCERGGNKISSLFRQSGLSTDKLRAIGLVVKSSAAKRQPDQKATEITLPSNFISLIDVKPNKIVARQAMAYLRNRGFTKEDILKYQIGYCEDGMYSHRIIIPSFDARGLLNYFVARTFITDEERKYHNPPLSRDIIPFELFINWDAPITLCEGYFDMKAILRNAIPLLGKGIGDALMIKLLSPSVKKIYLVLDRDALREALEHAETLMASGKKVYLVELSGKDPGKMGFMEYTRFVQKAKALTVDMLMKKKLQLKFG